ncbi:MAG: thermonuclease family protein [Candidatus Omnitrophota bacterium]
MFNSRLKVIIPALIGMLTFFPLTASAQDFFADSADSNAFQRVRVREVESTSRIELEDNTTVHLIGLKALGAPRRKKIERDQFGFVIEENDPVIHLEERALEFVRILLEGRLVRLEFDQQKHTADGDLLAYVYLADNDNLVNTEILRNGYADLSLQPPNIKYRTDLRAAYREARQEQRGLHNDF